jgi:hypothetical protein
MYDALEGFQLSGNVSPEIGIKLRTVWRRKRTHCNAYVVNFRQFLSSLPPTSLRR